MHLAGVSGRRTLEGSEEQNIFTSLVRKDLGWIIWLHGQIDYGPQI